MRQGIKNKNHSAKSIEHPAKEENHNYGTSKLEQDFAHDYLDRYNIPYEYQFHAKEIGRYYDFFLKESRVIIEVDGDYWHGNTDKFKKLNKMQLKSHAVDKIKDQWAHIHGIPIIRIWESDIRGNAPKVIRILKENKIIK